MRIRILKNSTCGSIEVPANEYWVSFNHIAGEFALLAGGKDLKIKGTKRRSVSKAKSSSIQFYKGGGKVWSLIANVPQHGEWVALIEES